MINLPIPRRTRSRRSRRCFSYLESKYQEEFCYLSYAEAGTLEKEHLEAYSGVGDTVRCGDRIFGHMKDGEYHYEDDYGNIGVRPLYESRVREFAVQSFPESGIKVFSDIRNLGQGTDGQSVTEENVLQDCIGSHVHLHF